MDLQKLKRSIEEMPRPAYIFLKYLLRLAAAMLAASLALHLAAGGDLARAHLAALLLETPAGILLLGAVGLGVLLDRFS